MSNTDAKRKNGMLFLLSTAAVIALLLFKPEWFWVMLPFQLTYLVEYLEMM
jgi:hypothetical protein